MQSTQRILSSRDCSTSGSQPQPLVSRNSRLAFGLCAVHSGLTSCRDHADLAVQHIYSRRRASRARRGRQSAACATLSQVNGNVDLPLVGKSLVSTTYVAETCLPTRTGKYRVRAYRHSVNLKHIGYQQQSAKVLFSSMLICLPVDRWRQKLY